MTLDVAGILHARCISLYENIFMGVNIFAATETERETSKN